MTATSLANLLPHEYLESDHERLEHMFDRLITIASYGDWRVCNAIWGAFSEDLESHMRHEEEELLPTYAASSPAATHIASQILIEHEKLRDELTRVGMELQRHSLRTVGAKEFLAQLREHGRRESTSVYDFWKQRERSLMATTMPATDLVSNSERRNFV